MKKYFDKVFFKSALVIAMPIVIQQLVTSLAQLVDNIMVGTINGQAIAGVGAVNSIFFVIMTSTFGISEGASIFIAQQYGAGKKDKMGNSLAISFSIIFLMAGIALTLINIFDESLLRMFIHGNDADSLAAMQYGMDYLNVLVWGYWLLMVNAVIGSAFRAIGQTKVPMGAGIVAVVANTSLNFLLIPIFGVKGAAVATIISRVAEFLILMSILKFKQTAFDFNLASFTTIKKEQFVMMIRKMVPLTTNEFLWGFGTSTLMALYGARSITDLASIQITYTIANILFVAMAGFGVAVAVLIGQKLGKEEFDLAIENSKKLLALGLLTGITFFGIAQVLAFFIPALYGNVDSVIQIQASNLLRIIGFVYPVYVITVTFFFTLRAGGDTLGVLIMDGGTMWGLSIPVGFILVYFTSVPIYGIFIGVQAFEVVKMLIGYYRYSRYNWVQNIS
ncbi:MATE family efflux transporter [Mollicutes bacterium LVI A0078]|nr:MATE family efflux transporter [Mollicutes bacterium LVI A0075]WOO91490.1 MATE family efflux transporter [Mollicutes bacterium LVI A0078]